MTPMQPLVGSRDTLGECPLWCEHGQRLWWTDIEGRVLCSAQADGSELRRVPMPDRVGSLALCSEPDLLLLALARGVTLWDTRRQAPASAVVAVGDGAPGLRLNDGRCDRQGRFVVGDFNEARGAAPRGHFHRVHADLRVERLPLPPVAVANSIAFSPDGTRMVFADSPTRCIQVVAYAADGALGAPEPFVELPPGAGYPDGATVDADGGLWSAHWDGGCVVRYDTTGRETTRLVLPARRVTCPVFFGPALDRLAVTSARIGLKDEVLQAQPASGAVFAAAVPPYRGLPEARFRVA